MNGAPEFVADGGERSLRDAHPDDDEAVVRMGHPGLWRMEENGRSAMPTLTTMKPS
jgi:hypothetical protein